MLQVYQRLFLERKILLVSKYKSLLTQTSTALMSFAFPFQWKHTLIPILPSDMIDVIDAPYPFLIGIE